MMLVRRTGVTDDMTHQRVFSLSWCLLLLQFVDLSCNELTEILIPEALPGALQELDLSGNANLVLEHKTLDIFR